MTRTRGLDALCTIAGLAVAAALLGACRAEAHSGPPTQAGAPTASLQPGPDILPTESLPAASPSPEGTLTLSGWFTIIRNHESHYFITDDQGVMVEVLLDDDVAAPLGGPLALDRTRVTIVGVLTSDAPAVVRALSIVRETEE